MANELYLSGLVSGLDSSEWINKILDVHRAGIAQVQRRQKALEVKKQAWSSIDDQLQRLRDKVATLRSHDTFFARQAVVTDTKVADATVRAAATAGSHELNVVRLARAHAVASGAVADAGAQLGIAGDITVAGTTVSVAATDTLYTLRDRINTAVSSVSAQVVQVASGASAAYQLVLTAKESGSSQAISFTDSAGAGVAALDQSGTAGIATAALTDTDAAAAGVYRVQVEQKAQYHQVAGSYMADPMAPSYTGTFKLNGAEITVAGVDLYGLRDAINGAGAGVTAAVTTDGADYRLELTSNTMGAGGAMAVDHDFDGVLQAAGVVHPNLGWQKELQSAQDAVFTINGQRYMRGYNSGITDVIAGVTLAVEGSGETTVAVGVTGGGVLRSLGLWSNGGSLAHEQSAAQDAEVVVNGRRHVRSSNEISDILDQVTLKLAGTGQTTVTVSQNTDDPVKGVEAFVAEFNKTVDLLNKLAGYNQDTKVAGPLFGDPLIAQVRRKLGELTAPVVGLPDTLNAAGQVGLTTGKWDTADYGRLKLDSAVLRSQLQSEPEGVAKLFGAVRVNVAATGTATASSNDAQAADVINGDVSPERWGSSGGGWESAAVPSSTSPQYLEIAFGATRTIDEVVVYSLGGTDAHPAKDNALADYRVQYWDGNDWQTVSTVENNTNATNFLTFAAVSTRKIRLEITATNGGKNAQVLEVQAYQINDGLASRMHSLVQTATGAGGIAARTDSLSTQIKSAGDRGERLQDRLVREEQRLRRQYAGLERIMAQFQNQGMLLAGMISGLGK